MTTLLQRVAAFRRDLPDHVDLVINGEPIRQLLDDMLATARPILDGQAVTITCVVHNVALHTEWVCRMCEAAAVDDRQALTRIVRRAKELMIAGEMADETLVADRVVALMNHVTERVPGSDEKDGRYQVRPFRESPQ